MSLLLPAHLHSPSLPEIAILQRTDVINPTTHFTTADVSILHEGKHHTTFHATLSRKGHKGEGKEFGVTDGVRWWDPYCRPREVVYKVATTPRAIELLKHEANVYRQLRKLQGKCVPLFHGLFEGFMQGEAAACIVIDYCGVPLKVTLDRVNRDDLKKVVDAVVAIHKAGVIHNDLYERNIVFLDGRPFIINFELAIPHKCSAPRIFIGGPQPNDYDFGCDELYILCSDEMANLWSPGHFFYFERLIPIEYALESPEKLAEHAPKGTPKEHALLRAMAARCRLAKILEDYWKELDSRLPLSECL